MTKPVGSRWLWAAGGMVLAFMAGTDGAHAGSITEWAPAIDQVVLSAVSAAVAAGGLAIVIFGLLWAFQVTGLVNLAFSVIGGLMAAAHAEEVKGLLFGEGTGGGSVLDVAIAGTDAVTALTAHAHILF